MILYFKILASFPIIYLVAVKRILTLPSYQAIFQFKQERILAVIKSVLVLVGSGKLCKCTYWYIGAYVHVIMITKCYMAYGKRVHYDIRGPYANHPIVSSRMSINYGRITC